MSLTLLFALACAPSTNVIGGDEGADTANTGDTQDTGANIGDTDTGDTQDTSPPKDVSEGEYVGTMTGTQASDWQTLDCSGDATVSVDADGAITGTLSCAFDTGGWGGWSYDGDVAGAEMDGDVTASWTVDLGYGDPYVAEGVGTYADGAMTIDFEYDMGNYGMFTGTVELERQ